MFTKKGIIDLSLFLLSFNQAILKEIARSFGISKETVISLPTLLKHLEIPEVELLNSDDNSFTL